MENSMTKKKVLILHGWMHSAQRYQRLKDDLEKYHNCIVVLYEFPGFGETKKKYVWNILQHYVKDVKEHLTKNKYDCIIAHSMGGNVILKALEEMGEEGKLILLSPAYYGIRKMCPLILFLPLIYIAFLLSGIPGKITGFFMKLVALLTINKWNQIDTRIITDAQNAHPIVATHLLFELSFDRWRTQSWNNNGRKVSVIIGENDRIISRKNMLQLQDDLENCTLEIINGIGHTAVVEAYGELKERILKNLLN